MFTEKVSVTTTIVDDVDPGFIRNRSGRERRRPVLPTGPVHSGPASPVTATCPPSASRQSRPRRRPAIARRQPGDCDRTRPSMPTAAARRRMIRRMALTDSRRPGSPSTRPPLRTRRNSGPSWWPAAARRVDPGDGRRPEIQHGAPAFLIGFRRADQQPAGAVRFRLHVPDIERGHLGHPQQPIAGNRQQGGVAEAGDGPVVVGGDRGRGVDFAEAHPVDLAPAAALAFPSKAGQYPVRCRPGRRGEALQPKAELDGRREPGGVQARKVEGQAGVGEVLPRERGVEAFEGGGIGPLGVCCNRGGAAAGNGGGRRGERRGRDLYQRLFICVHGAISWKGITCDNFNYTQLFRLCT